MAFLLAFLLGIGWYAKAVLEERDQLRETAAAQQEALKLASKVVTTTSVVMSERVQSSASIKTKAKDVQVAIQRRIPVDAGCVLPASWRVLHDTAATNAEVPAATRGADEETVTPQQAAITVTSNYEVCLDNADRLDKLQQWVEGIRK